MAENLNEVLIGSRGWLHPGWEGGFYPDDLPPDWRLAYYANEFPMVVIREQEWAQIADIQALREDCPDTFRFVVELNREDMRAQLEHIGQLGEQCAGVIVAAEQGKAFEACRPRLPEKIPCYRENETDSLITVSSGTSLKQLRAYLETALQPAAMPSLLIVDGKPPDIELLRQAGTLLTLL